MATRENNPVEVAYDYAWWLTGDDDQAARAVQTFERITDLPDALATIRLNAIDERTMCPASELALLHDRALLPLDQAARIAVVPEADARTELAHGRLEALEATVDSAFVHPERLGGLAVANPADVAHARTCDDCASALESLREGRAALEAIPLRASGPAEQAEGARDVEHGAPPSLDEEDSEPAMVPAWAWLVLIAIAATAGTGVYLGWP